MRVAITGGGTGGHIYPALAIDGALRAAFTAQGIAYEARFFGNAGGLEASLVTTMPVEFIPSAPLQRKLSLGTLRTMARNVLGIVLALGSLARFRPDYVVATGGYVTFPVVFAARILRVLRVLHAPIALLEINVTPGLTNKILAPVVDEVWTSYAASERIFGKKAVLTGAPVRASLRALPDAVSARRRLGLDPLRMTIVAMGGSQGARSINEAVAALVTRRTLPESWQVLHVSGERDFAYMQGEERELAPGNKVELVPYLADPTDAYAAADIVIGRAGASTLAELAVTGTPAVLIPYPFAAENHQEHNARIVAESGSAVVLLDAELDHDRLWWLLKDALEPERLRAMRAAARSLAVGDAEAAIVERIRGALAARGAGGSPAKPEQP